MADDAECYVLPTTPVLYDHHSYECGQHEAKARERKEELEGQAKEIQNSLSEFEGSEDRMKEMRFAVKRPLSYDGAFIALEGLQTWVVNGVVIGRTCCAVKGEVSCCTVIGCSGLWRDNLASLLYVC